MSGDKIITAVAEVVNNVKIFANNDNDEGVWIQFPRVKEDIIFCQILK